MTAIIPSPAGCRNPGELGRDLESDVEIFNINLPDRSTGEMVLFPHFRRDGRDIPAFRVLYAHGVRILTDYSIHSIYRKAARGELAGRRAPRRKDGTFARKGRIEVVREVFLAASKDVDQLVQQIEQEDERRQEIAGLKIQMKHLSEENESLREYLAVLTRELG